jgi:hypothetical protein
MHRRATPVPAMAPQRTMLRPFLLVEDAATSARLEAWLVRQAQAKTSPLPRPRRLPDAQSLSRTRTARVLSGGGAAPPGRHGRPVDPIALSPEDRIATAGSCFAQHIGNALAARGRISSIASHRRRSSRMRQRRGGSAWFSRRYGNVYTARQMLQLAQEALAGGARWTPCGNAKGAFTMRCARRWTWPAMPPRNRAAGPPLHLRVRTMLETMDVLVFTLGDRMLGKPGRWHGLSHRAGHPGGQFRPHLHAFRNLRHGEVLADMAAFWALVKEVNPRARLLLTVSPVPLVATASEGTCCPPRSIPNRCCARWRVIWPPTMPTSPISSYEITGHPSRGMFFNPDLRTVNAMGVDLVMRSSPALASAFARKPTRHRSDLRKPDRRNPVKPARQGSPKLSLPVRPPLEAFTVLCGMPRCGTRQFADFLNAHPRLCLQGEIRSGLVNTIPRPWMRAPAPVVCAANFRQKRRRA